MRKILSDFKLGEQGLNKILGNLESDVMDIVWSKDGEVTVRDVLEVLLSKRSIAYTTVMTIMFRLADKKILNKRLEGNTSFFIPSMNRDDFTKNVVGNVIDSLLEDFADDAIAHFVSRVKKEDRKMIEKLERLLQEEGKIDGAY